MNSSDAETLRAKPAVLFGAVKGAIRGFLPADTGRLASQQSSMGLCEKPTR